MEFIEINKAVMHYKWIDNKKEKTFLFINSLGSDFRIWDKVVPRLEKHGNILLYDKRGHGLSDLKINTVKGLETYVEDVLGLIDAMPVQKLIVVGISLGGMIGQLLAYKRPELIRQLILCDTGSKIGTADIWNSRIEAIKKNGLAAISEGVINRWLFEEYHNKNKAEAEGLKNMLERTLPEAYIKACEIIRDTDLTYTTKQIELPSLCIVGSEDVSTSPGLVKDLSSLLRRSQFKTIDKSAHLPCIDNAGILSEMIIDFINK
jgi:3-oxoadipate enol-lactonase